MKRFFPFSVLAGLLILTGCQNTVNTVENTEKTMDTSHVKNTRMITDTFLKNRLGIRNIHFSETSDGFRRVQLEIINRRVGLFSQIWSGITGENPYPVRYKFIWFNRQGMVEETPLSDWQDVTIIPGETLYLQSVAPNRNCTDFKISFKEK